MGTLYLQNETSFQNIDLSNPIKWEHPLNRGLIGWWLALPQWSGGTKFYDLCGRNHGTLTSMTPADDWQGGARDGGYGTLDYDRTGYVNVPNSNSLAFAEPFTATFWLKIRSFSGKLYGLIEKTAGTSANDNLGIWYDDRGGVDRIRFQLDSEFEDWLGCGTRLLSWTNICCIWDGSRMKIYADGVEVVSNFRSPVPVANSRALAFGAFSQDAISTGRLDGQMDDVRLYNRPLGHSEVAEYYNVSRRSYSGLLNRTSLFLPLSIIEDSDEDPNTALSVELDSLVDNAGAVGPEIDNTTDLYMYDNLELHIASFDGMPKGGGVVELHIVVAMDGESYQDGTDPSELWSCSFVEAIHVRKAATEQRHILTKILLPPHKFRYALLNKTGTTFAASGNTLKRSPQYGW